MSAWAPTDTGCLDQAVRGLVATFARAPADMPARSVAFECPPAADTELLVRVLEEVIYLLDVHDLVATGAALQRTANGGLAGQFTTVPRTAVRPVGPAPKAITRHRLGFTRTDTGGWRCTVTVDV